MYITTSRKPSLLSKRLCRALARLLPRGMYENRGKKNVEEIAERGRRLGKTRALVLHELNGNPDSLVFMEIGKEWSWLSPKVTITKLGSLPAQDSLPRPSHIHLDGGMKEKSLALFNFEPESGEEEVRLVLGKEDWSFYSGKKKLFSFGVSYG